MSQLTLALIISSKAMSELNQPSSTGPPTDPKLPAGPYLSEHTTASHNRQSDSSPGSKASSLASPRQPQQVSETACMDTAEQQALALSVLDFGVQWTPPSQFVWADIETVALRVLVTLHWASHGRAELKTIADKTSSCTPGWPRHGPKTRHDQCAQVWTAIHHQCAVTSRDGSRRFGG